MSINGETLVYSAAALVASVSELSGVFSRERQLEPDAPVFGLEGNDRIVEGRSRRKRCRAISKQYGFDVDAALGAADGSVLCVLHVTASWE
jgi:hypothetical protein